MIRHAAIGQAAAIGFLPVALIPPALRTLLVAAIGGTPLLQSGLLAAIRAAVGMATVAVLANPERGLASTETADPLQENRSVSRHVRVARALDNGRESWQVRTECW
jgi:hypothetical protein